MQYNVIEFIDIKAQYAALQREIDMAVGDVLKSGHFILGDEVLSFEKKSAKYLGVNNAISCGNGTDALELIFRLIDVKQGDAIFVPDMTFIASIEPACALGATPVFCDIDLQTYNILPASLEERIEQVLNEGELSPKCIVAVDFLGNPCDYSALKSIASKYDILLIEDAAQSFGASYYNEKCGSIGDFSSTSFFPTKPLGCYGDGGAIFTNDDTAADLLRSLRSHGQGMNKYDNVRIGMNSRLDALQAAILKVKLLHLENEVNIRSELATKYNEAFCDYFHIQKVLDGCQSAFAQYSILASDSKQRNEIMDELKLQGIPTLVYYPTPLHRLPVFRETKFAQFDYPNADRYADTSFAIPFSPYMRLCDQEKVISCVLNLAGKIERK